MLDYLKYILMGIVQGVSEVLPISSSGHTLLFNSLLGINLPEEQMALLSVFLHFASLVALIIFFWRDIWKMIIGTWNFLFSKDPETKANSREGFMLFAYLVVASIPVAIVGLLFEETVTNIFGSLLIVGIFFLITGLILLFVGIFTKKSQDNQYTWKNTLIAGAFQIIGVLPGISRSGITMSGAKIAGLNDEKAKHFAFLLFLPVAAGSFIFSIDDFVFLASTSTSQLPLFIVATIFSFIFTVLGLLFIIKKFNLSHYKWFAIYMFAVGTFTIFYSLLR